MLNEPSGLSDSATITVPAREVSQPDPQTIMRSRLRRAVDQVFLVEFESYDMPEPITASYQGQLLMDSMEAYDKLDSAFKALDHVPVFVTEGNTQVIRAMNGRFRPQPRPIWPNVLLLALTILSLLYVGAISELGGADLSSPFDLLRGWPYALCVMLILGTHELGHYFAARHHKVAVTLPYFIPFPIPGTLGTMGAFIQLREPMRNRRVLLDVGAAGPLVGLIVAIPILLIGLRTSPVLPLPISDLFMLKARIISYSMEGNSLLYIAAKFVAFGHLLPDGMSDVFINQVAMAGWTGLLVTALNLIPIGQLDGGHTLYSLIGDRARQLYFPLLILLGVMSVFYEGWLIWLILILVLGRVYATPLDMITRLDPRRRLLSVVTLVMFILVFMPLPMQIITVGSAH